MHTVRSASRADIAHLAQIELAAGSAFPADRIPDPTATLPQAVLGQAFDAQLLMVAEVDHAVVGFAAGLDLAPWIHLEEVSVHPDFGRRGIGADLVKSILDAARDRGAQGVTLTTFSDFNWNAPFYRRLGFVVIEAGAPPHLESHLAHEASLGMINRVGMIYQTQRRV